MSWWGHLAIKPSLVTFPKQELVLLQQPQVEVPPGNQRAIHKGEKKKKNKGGFPCQHIQKSEPSLGRLQIKH